MSPKPSADTPLLPSDAGSTEAQSSPHVKIRIIQYLLFQRHKRLSKMKGHAECWLQGCPPRHPVPMSQPRSTEGHAGPPGAQARRRAPQTCKRRGRAEPEIPRVGRPWPVPLALQTGRPGARKGRRRRSGVWCRPACGDPSLSYKPPTAQCREGLAQGCSRLGAPHPYAPAAGEPGGDAQVDKTAKKSDMLSPC